MNQIAKEKLDIANQAKAAFAVGQLTQEEALQQVKPYVDYYNETAKRIATKYDMKPRLMRAYTFLKSPVR